jgi:hypothetical protein
LRETPDCDGDEPIDKAGVVHAALSPLARSGTDLMHWRYSTRQRARPGSNQPIATSPWLWLFATLAGVLIAAGLVAGARKVVVTSSARVASTGAWHLARLLPELLRCRSGAAWSAVSVHWYPRDIVERHNPPASASRPLRYLSPPGSGSPPLFR